MCLDEFGGRGVAQGLGPGGPLHSATRRPKVHAPLEAFLYTTPILLSFAVPTAYSAVLSVASSARCMVLSTSMARFLPRWSLLSLSNRMTTLSGTVDAARRIYNV